jgi:hypothetical protein
MWIYNVHYYCLLADCQFLSMFSVSKVSKLYFHIQFKSQNVQINVDKHIFLVGRQDFTSFFFFIFLGKKNFEFFLGYRRTAEIANILMISKNVQK